MKAEKTEGEIVSKPHLNEPHCGPSFCQALKPHVGQKLLPPPAPGLYWGVLFFKGVRGFSYIYAAVSPREGQKASMAH